MKAKTVILVLIINLVLCELVAALFFYFGSLDFVSNDFRKFKVSSEEMQKFKDGFDSTLGWKPKFSTSQGERPGSLQKVSVPIYAVTYGDSFTFGAWTENEQTWQHYMEEMLGMRVLNFGVGSYGVDQSVKYFLMNEEKKLSQAKFAVLGFIDDDLNRNMTSFRNVLRGFAFDFPLTKPRFELQGEKLIFLPNPIQSPDEFNKFSDDQFVQNLLQTDWFYNYYKFPNFPYIMKILDPNFARLLKGFRGRNHFSDPERSHLFKALLELFKQKACSVGKVPVIVRFPTLDMFDSSSGSFKAVTEDYNNKFEAICAELQIFCYFPLQEFEQSGITENHFLPDNGNHYNASGNKLFAQLFASYLSKLDENLQAQNSCNRQ